MYIYVYKVKDIVTFRKSSFPAAGGISVNSLSSYYLYPVSEYAGMCISTVKLVI